MIVLYAMDEIIQMDRGDAVTIYSWVLGSIVIFKIAGALLGDLFLGNKKAIILGGILQILGISILCIPSQTAFFIGLILTVLGTGFLWN